MNILEELAERAIQEAQKRGEFEGLSGQGQPLPQESDPFMPEIRDNKIWARGADDDKGQLFMHVKAFEYLEKNGGSSSALNRTRTNP